MAGGKGTRVSSIAADIPKPMLALAGKSVLAHQLDALRNQGITEVTLVIGHLAQVIEEYFGDGTAFGMHIQYIIEPQPLGTAGALGMFAPATQDILVINGDLIFSVDIARFHRAHQATGALATVLTHPNSHPYDSSVLQCDQLGRVTSWLTTEDERGWYQNRVNAGLHILSPELVNTLLPVTRRDLDRDVLRPLISTGKLFAYHSPEYVCDMGTPERLTAVERDITAGVIARRNLTTPQEAVFLDRDGTINVSHGFLNDINQLELISGMARYIADINRSGRLAIVITNQPVIARGELTWDGLHAIHAKLETLLGEQGAYLDDIFVCPHHPDAGFPGEVGEYKIVCDCRKPKPGLFYQAAERYHIDLAASVMVGDQQRDKLAAVAAGCRFVWAKDIIDAQRMK
jgi:D-glycero-D-manno-heptose 1,7-bisphosphate phosphatase